MSLLSAVLTVALAAPGTLRAALDHYDFGEYGTACQQLEGLRAAGLPADDDRVALRYLGACHHFLGAEAKSRAAFEALLAAEPAAELDPVQFPPELVSFFREVRARRPASAAGASPSAVDAPSTAAPRRSRGVAFLPFGAGQFQNGQPGKGAIFASLEGVALGVGVVGLALFEAEKDSGGLLAGGTFEDEEKAQQLQMVYVAGFATFAALWAIGVGDALANFDEPAVAVLPLPGGAVLGGRF